MPWRKLFLLNLPSLTWFFFFFHVVVDWRSYASCPAIARSLLWKTVDLPILVTCSRLRDGPLSQVVRVLFSLCSSSYVPTILSESLAQATILVESEPLHDHVARILSVKNANRSNCILRFVTSKENTKKTIKQSSRTSPYLDRYLCNQIIHEFEGNLHWTTKSCPNISQQWRFVSKNFMQIIC